MFGTLQHIPSLSKNLRTVVTAVDLAIKANPEVDFGAIPKGVFFMHGHPKEIVAVLQGYTDSPEHKDKKYPLIALLRDVPETIGQGNCGLSSESKNRIVICTLTDPEFRADQREAASFDKVLIPVFEEFVNQLGLSSAFGCPTVDELNILKWDRYYWGSQVMDSNTLNDYIDAIDIERIMLKMANSA